MKPGESLISPKQITVTPGYMETLGIQLVRGRYFDERDHENAPGVILIDEQLASKFWAGTDPIGKRMYQPSDINNVMKTDERTRWLTVVGVVRPVRLEDLAGSASTAGAYYFPYAQNAGAGGAFALKTVGGTESIARAMRFEIAQVDPELALFELRTMVERAELSLASRKTSMLVALGFGTLALFLAAIGIYSVLAYLVTQRTREIGIRLALGSSPGGIFQLLVREGLTLTAIGLALGGAGSALLRTAVERQIYGVRPFDPLVMGTAVLLLGAIAIAASVVPARRAMRVDPVTVLNEQ
jgi:putative ABC transport system permease protein